MDKTDAQKIKFNCIITHPPQRLQIDGFVITVVKNLFTAFFQMSIFGQKFYSVLAQFLCSFESAQKLITSLRRGFKTEK